MTYAKYSDRYTAQMRKYELGLRMNIDVDITPTTLAQFSMLGQLRERKRPNTSEYDLFAGFSTRRPAPSPCKRLMDIGAAMMY